MLGLPEFRLLGAAQVQGELELTVETAAVGWCETCGVRARSKGRYDTLVRDVSAFGRRVRLRWRKRRWRCPERLCPAGTWTETSAAVRPRAVLTERARAHACRRVGEGGEAVAAVARDLGVGWPR